MAFPLDDILLGPAAFGKRRGTEGFVWHTTEAADASRASAVGTAIWQKSNPGSYGWIIYDGGLLLTVPYLEASGGVNPASAAWAPGRYPFLRQSLSPAAYADPNAYLINVAFSGKTAVFRDQGMPPNMIDTAVWLTRWVEAQSWSKTPLIHSGHMHWQTNRSDPSQPVLDRIAAAYGPLPDTSLPEDDMKIPAGARQVAQGIMEFGTGLYQLPRLTAPARTMPKRAFVAVFGRTKGDVFNGSADWLWVGYDGEFAFAAASNVTDIALTEVGTDLIRVVPTDCTPQVNLARQTTADKANAQMDAWTAARPTIAP